MKPDGVQDGLVCVFVLADDVGDHRLALQPMPGARRRDQPDAPTLAAGCGPGWWKDHHFGGPRAVDHRILPAVAKPRADETIIQLPGRREIMSGGGGPGIGEKAGW
jgi:hypothetical protein